MRETCSASDLLWMTSDSPLLRVFSLCRRCLSLGICGVPEYFFCCFSLISLQAFSLSAFHLLLLSPSKRPFPETHQFTLNPLRPMYLSIFNIYRPLPHLILFSLSMCLFSSHLVRDRPIDITSLHPQLYANQYNKNSNL